MMLPIVASMAGLFLAQQSSATVSVRIVDLYRASIPGMNVRLTEVSDCTTLTPNVANQHSAMTKADGSVEFFVPSGRAYLVAVESQGGFEGTDDCIDRADVGMRYSQIELRPDLSGQVTLIQPALEPTRQGALGLGDLVGVYADEAGQLYEVTLLDGVGGVGLSLPRGGLLRFPERRDLTFRGPDGTIRFRVRRGQVVGITVTRDTVTAGTRR